MTTRKSCLVGAALLAMSVFAAPCAEAKYVVTFVQNGSNVLETGHGTLDITDLMRLTNVTSGAFIAPSDGVFQSGPHGEAMGLFFGDVSGPHSLGAGDPTLATLSTGSPVGISGEMFESVLVFPDYMSGAPLSESSLYLNATFASLQLTPGAYVWSWGSGDHADTFTIDVGAGAVGGPVPEPSTWAMILIGFAALGCAAIKRAGFRATA